MQIKEFILNFKKMMILFLVLFVNFIVYISGNNSVPNEMNEITDDAQYDLPEIPVNTIDTQVSGVINRLNETHYPRNEIEYSRNATVLIETSWGVTVQFPSLSRRG